MSVINFVTGSDQPKAEGRLGWDDGYGTLNLGLKGGNVNLAIGEELFIRAFNAEGTTLTKGTVVYISGSQGNRVSVKRASATAELGSANTLGFVAEQILSGAEGFIQTEGPLNELNTLGLIAGGLVYLSSSAGQYTQTPPQAPLHAVRLGYVERVNATVGSIYVKIDNGYEIGELHDVIDSTTTASFGDLLVKSGSVWINSKQLTGSYQLTGSLNITGSNTLVGNQTITGSISVSGSQTFIGTSVSVGNQIVTGSLITSGSNILIGSSSLSGSVAISGSVNASANITLQGHLRLDPTQDPGNVNQTSSFLFTSASNTATGFDLYYRQNGNVVKFKWLEGGLSSGILYGGNISFSGSVIYVKKGSGIINNMNAVTSSEIAPIITYVNWNDYTASAQYISSSQTTYLYVDSTGTIFQQTSYFDQTQYEQAIPLGLVTHPNYSTISGYSSAVQTTYNSDAQQNDFVRSFGPIKVSGFTPSGQSGSLRINIGDGTAFSLGGFYTQDPNSPSHYTATPAYTASMARAYRSGSGVYLDSNNGNYYTVIDPTKYDNGNGLSNVSGTNVTIQRLFYNPESKRVVIYYGQTTYTSIANALAALPSDSFTEGEFTAKSLVFVGYVLVQGNASDLSNTTQAVFIQAGTFRNIAGGSSGATNIAQNLNDLSDVNITSPTNGQALIYDGGAWINGVPLNSTSASFASTASLAITALTASFADNFTVKNTLIAQTIISQVITSSR